MFPAPNVLHICSDFAKQRVYPELVANLAALGVSQFVYVPVRSPAEVGVNRNDALPQVGYRYAHVLRPYHRLMFRSKIRVVVRDLLLHVDLSSIALTHAHFLFSDGAAALQLAKRRRLPYIVAVRNTDVNAFLRLRPDLHSLCWEIIRKATRVVFIAPAYLDLLLRRVPSQLQPILRSKALIIPNGLSQFWLDHSGPERDDSAAEVRLLYVGDFSKNKNIVRTIRATALVNETHRASLTLVGSGGDGEVDVDALLATGNFPFVHRLGRIENRADLAEIYRSHDIFVMPSFRETFGVAYIEALSQGLPVIFTRGQGIDGYFEPGTVGESVDPSNEREIRDAVLALYRRLALVRGLCVEVAQRFSWPAVAARYRSLYEAAIGLPARSDAR